MEKGPLNDRILSCFDRLSAQLQRAARYIADHPRDVAMLSMREQARCADLSPATMSRLAKRLGFEGYEGIRTLYQHALRDGRIGFSDKANAQARQQKQMGDEGLLTEMFSALRGQVERLAEPQALAKLSLAAKLLSSAQTIYCLGLRASHAIAWQLHYILSLIGTRSILLDGIAATGADPIAHATKGDLLLVVGINPYTRLSVEIAQFAFAQGIPILAITDSALSPLARLSKTTILVQTENSSFFHSLTSAFAVAEALGSLVAGHRGDDTLTALERSDKQLAAFKTHYSKSASRSKP